ncbi:MAG: tRNA lysidine(34) synthetase TilS [Bryobacteraceae bacterium]|nr:tRNA lysidine(34) synthetase TilS [Bryobacteraceae bacterium]
MSVQNPIEPGSPPALIEAAIFRHAMAADGARLGAAVSGGADSVCLLVSLARLAPEHGWSLTVLHLNHGVRGAEADADTAWVEELCARLGLACHCARQLIEPGADWENRARQARLRFFREQMKQFSLDRVATGHTLDDQAETVLLRLLRGAGPEGLSSILPVTREGLIRPMLGVTHVQARDWLAAQGLSWREDASNQHVHHTRNWLRHEVMPLLAGRFPAAGEALARHAAAAFEDRMFWASAVERAVENLFQTTGGALVAGLDGIRSVARPLRQRVLRAALGRYAKKMVDAAQLDAVLDLVEGRRSAGRIRLAGVEAWLSMRKVRIGRPVAHRFIEPVEVPAAGTYPMAWRGTSLWVSRLEAPPATLRGWQPGDRAGWGKPGRSLKEEFQRARIPAWERAGWPVLAVERQVIWAGALGSAQEVEATELVSSPEWGPGSPI